MTEIELGYGQRSVTLKIDPARFSLLSVPSEFDSPLTDVEIGTALDSPIESPPLDDLVHADDSVLLVVSDATRATGSAQIVNLVVRRLIQAGVSPANISIIFATGIHRPVTEQETIELLTPFIVQRIKTVVHNAYDESGLTNLGVTGRGVPVSVNKVLTEFSKIVLIGGISFHYFAGFTGGRKSICPGLASATTIEGTYMLALDFEKGGRKAGVGTGLLNGNAVHEECERVASLVKPAFGINTIIDEKKRVVGIYCGDWKISHRSACEAYLANHSLAIQEKRDLVIVSCGGFPHDINMIQAHKSLDMAAHACKEGGAIVLLAECRDGLGRDDFLKWFDSENSGALENRLRQKYEVNGQTAWSLLTKTERYRVYILTDLPDATVSLMRMKRVDRLDTALDQLGSIESAYVLPHGARVLPRLSTVELNE